jgi:hypothetical protein
MTRNVLEHAAECAAALGRQTQSVLASILGRSNTPDQPAMGQAMERDRQSRLVDAKGVAQSILTQIRIAIDEDEKRKLSGGKLLSRGAAQEVFEKGGLSFAQPVTDELTQRSDFKFEPCLGKILLGHDDRLLD